MKKVEIVLVSLALIAMVLRLFGMPLAFLLCVIIFLLLADVYMFFSFLLLNDIPLRKIFKKEAYAATSGLRIAQSVLVGLVFSVSVMAILFLLGKWPGNRIMTYSSMILYVPVIIISLIGYIPKPSKFHRGILLRSAIMVVVSLLLVVFY